MVYTRIPHANTQALRQSLQIKCRAEDAKLHTKAKAHADIRPPTKRLLPAKLSTPVLDRPEYVPLYRPLALYDVEIREGHLNRLTDRRQQAAYIGWPETAEMNFRKELCKLIWLATGKLSKESIEQFIPIDLLGPGLEERQAQWINEAYKVQYYLRSNMFTKFLFPVLLGWIQDARFLVVDTTSRAARRQFFLTKEQEDERIVYDFVAPFASTLNREFIWYQNYISDQEERHIQHIIKEFIRTYFVHACDIVYMCNIDQNTDNSAHKFMMYNTELLGETTKIYGQNNIRPLLKPAAEFPSFDTIKKRRATKDSSTLQYDPDDYLGVEAFLEPDTSDSDSSGSSDTFASFGSDDENDENDENDEKDENDENGSSYSSDTFESFGPDNSDDENGGNGAEEELGEGGGD